MTPPDRTLYLEGRECIRVLRDGPALRVRVPQRADQLYPVRLLSGVVVSGNVQWENSALRACAEAGVIVSFVDGDGEPLAHLMPAERVRGVIDVTDAVERYFVRPEAKARYKEWLEQRIAEEHRSLLGLSQPLGRWPAAHEITARLFRAACKHAPRRMVRRFDACLAGLLRTRVAAYLRAGGLDLTSAVLVAARVAPARDLTAVLWWRLLARRVSFIRREFSRLGEGVPAGKTALRLAAQFLEQEREDLDARMDRLRKKWFAWLIGELRGYGH